MNFNCSPATITVGAILCPKFHLFKSSEHFVGTLLKNFMCDFCGHKYHDRHSLMSHVRTHTGERPFQCASCNKCFMSASGLKRHLHGHAGIRPHQCDECGKSFGQRSHMIAHKRCHTGERPYACAVCPKTFGYSGDLRKHFRFHSGEQEAYTCIICQEQFINSRLLKIHMDSHIIDRPSGMLTVAMTF